MKVKELIIQLLEEDMDEEVFLDVGKDDAAIVDGIRPNRGAFRGLVYLTCDVKVVCE